MTAGVDLEQRVRPDGVERAVREDQLGGGAAAGLHPVAVEERRARIGVFPFAGRAFLKLDVAFDGEELRVVLEVLRAAERGAADGLRLDRRVPAPR